MMELVSSCTIHVNCPDLLSGLFGGPELQTKASTAVTDAVLARYRNPASLPSDGSPGQRHDFCSRQPLRVTLVLYDEILYGERGREAMKRSERLAKENLPR